MEVGVMPKFNWEVHFDRGTDICAMPKLQTDSYQNIPKCTIWFHMVSRKKIIGIAEWKLMREDRKLASPGL